MELAAKHTPIKMDAGGVMKTAAGRQVAAVCPGEMREFGKFICRAANSHDAMLAALKEARATMIAPAAAYEPVINQIDVAIALATQVQS